MSVCYLTNVCDLITVALEKQRQEYERQFQQLRNILSPSTPYPPYSYDPLKLGKMNDYCEFFVIITMNSFRNIYQFMCHIS